MNLLKPETDDYGIVILNHLDELRNEDLVTLTEGYKLPKHYCIIALACTTKLYDLCITVNNRKDHEVGVVPILAKISEEDSENVNAKVGDKLIIDRSSLERGYHVNIPTMISSNNIRKWLVEHINFTRNICAHKDSLSKSNIVMVEFKIVPVVDIHGSIDRKFTVKDRFRKLMLKPAVADSENSHIPTGE